jgi:hypothetical protein
MAALSQISSKYTKPLIENALIPEIVPDPSVLKVMATDENAK